MTVGSETLSIGLFGVGISRGLARVDGKAVVARVLELAVEREKKTEKEKTKEKESTWKERES